MMGLKLRIPERCPACGLIDGRDDGDYIWRGLHQCEKGPPGPVSPPQKFPPSQAVFMPASPLDRLKPEHRKIVEDWMATLDDEPDWHGLYLGMAAVAKQQEMRANAPTGDAAKWLGELLAVIHGDGGHYLAEHGMRKAVEDAHRRISTERARPEPQGETEAVGLLRALTILRLMDKEPAIAQIEAELAALRQSLASAHEQGRLLTRAEHAECDAADAARYRWLKANKLRYNGAAWHWFPGEPLWDDNLDAAIDAAQPL